MKIIQFIKSKTFWANVLVAVLLCVGLFFGLKYWLNSYTHHGEGIEVPDLARMEYSEAQAALEDVLLEAEILDTAEFNPKYPRGSILDQYPMAGNHVKEGRAIRLTLNPLKARKIEMPNLIEKTKRRAIYDLESKGFKVGELSYVPYIGKDVVVDVKVKGFSVQPKVKFEKGTEIDLVLGAGLGSTQVPMPYLRFLKLEDATKQIQAASLNLGTISYDAEVQDTANAVVYNQQPNPSHKPTIVMGSEVDIWLTNDYTKIPNDSLNFFNQNVDTTLNESP